MQQIIDNKDHWKIFGPKRGDTNKQFRIAPRNVVIYTGQQMLLKERNLGDYDGLSKLL
jgi:hypothetical protein